MMSFEIVLVMMMMMMMMCDTMSDGQEEEGTCLEISRIGLIAKESESSSARAIHWRRVDERCRERDGCLLLGWRNCGRQQEVAHSPCSLRVHATLEEEEQEEEEEETTM